MNRQFDNRFDELFNEKFKDFDKNPPDYILEKVKASVENQSLISKIGNYYKNNLLLAGLSLLIPALIIGFYSFTGKKDVIEDQQVLAVNESVVKAKVAQSNDVVSQNEISVTNKETKISRASTLIFNEETCGLTCNLKATSNQGEWNCSSEGVTFSAINSATTVVSVPSEGRYTFIWTPSNDLKSIEKIQVKFNNQAKTERKKELISCSSEVALEAGSANQTGVWTAENGVIFKNANNSKTTAVYNGTGKVNMIWTSNMKCALADTFSVIFAENNIAKIDITDAAKCFDSPVILSVKNNSGSRYEWEAENGNINKITPNSVSISWANGQKNKVTLKTWTKDNCFASSSIVVEKPAPVDVTFDIKAAQCSNNGAVKAIATNAKSSYQYFWMNEKKSSSSAKEGLAPGNYKVEVVDLNGCSKSYSLEIPGTGALKASFYHSNYEVTPPSTIYFVNTTTENNSIYGNSDAIKFEWDFGDGQKSTEESPSHVYENSGTYIVKLTAINSEGCSNAVVATDITIDPSHVVVPNVFSPNGDGLNDIFKVNAVSLSKFHARISNSKGEMVFEWSDPEKGWDGTILKSGAKAAAGVYFYIVNAVGKDGKQYEDKGAVQLVRE